MAVTHSTVYARFSEYLFSRRGLGEVTVNNQVATIRRLAPAIGVDPTAEAIDRYITAMRKTGASYSHVVNTAIAIEHYMEFLGRPIQLGRPRKPRRLIHGTLSEAEITLLIAASRNLRQRAILSLLAYSGLRNKELCQLTIGDVDLANQWITVRAGKGQKDRTANIASACVSVMADYLRERHGQAHERLFVTLRKGEPYQPQVLRKLVRAAAARAGISKRVWPHLFRHSLATNLLHRGANLMAIREQLGHVFLETTAIYLHSSPERLQMEYRMYSPSYL
jgi:integrase/recombinase XerD